MSPKVKAEQWNSNDSALMRRLRALVAEHSNAPMNPAFFLPTDYTLARLELVELAFGEVVFFR